MRTNLQWDELEDLWLKVEEVSQIQNSDNFREKFNCKTKFSKLQSNKVINSMPTQAENWKQLGETFPLTSFLSTDDPRSFSPRKTFCISIILHALSRRCNETLGIRTHINHHRLAEMFSLSSAGWLRRRSMQFVNSAGNTGRARCPSLVCLLKCWN